MGMIIDLLSVAEGRGSACDEGAQGTIIVRKSIQGK